MKRLILGSALLGIAGALGSADAAPISATSTALWNALTPGATSTSNSQNGLPAAFPALGNPIMTAGNALTITGSGSINFNINGTNTTPTTISTFLNSSPGYTFTCAACSTTLVVRRTLPKSRCLSSPSQPQAMVR